MPSRELSARSNLLKGTISTRSKSIEPSLPDTCTMPVHSRDLSGMGIPDRAPLRSPSRELSVDSKLLQHTVGSRSRSEEALRKSIERSPSPSRRSARDLSGMGIPDIPPTRMVSKKLSKHSNLLKKTICSRPISNDASPETSIVRKASKEISCDSNLLRDTVGSRSRCKEHQTLERRPSKKSMLEASMHFDNRAELFLWSDYDINQRRGHLGMNELFNEQDGSGIIYLQATHMDRSSRSKSVEKCDGSPSDRAALAIDQPAKCITSDTNVLGEGGCLMSPFWLPPEKPFRPGRRPKSMPPTLAQKSWDMLKPSHWCNQISAENYAWLLGRPTVRSDCVEHQTPLQLQDDTRSPSLTKGVAPQSPRIAWNQYHHVGESILNESSLEDIFPSSPKKLTNGSRSRSFKANTVHARKKQKVEENKRAIQMGTYLPSGTYYQYLGAPPAKAPPKESVFSVEQLGTYSFGPIQTNLHLSVKGEAVAEGKDGKMVSVSTVIQAVKDSQDQEKSPCTRRQREVAATSAAETLKKPAVSNSGVKEGQHVVITTKEFQTMQKTIEDLQREIWEMKTREEEHFQQGRPHLQSAFFMIQGEADVEAADVQSKAFVMTQDETKIVVADVQSKADTENDAESEIDFKALRKEKREDPAQVLHLPCSPTSLLPTTPSTASSTPCSNSPLTPSTAPPLTPSTATSTPRFLRISQSIAGSSPADAKPLAARAEKKEPQMWCDEERLLGA